VTLAPATTIAVNGWIELQVGRFDPLTGWQFHRLCRVRARRARASDLGTLRFSPSRSGYVYVLVATPLPGSD
jgi:hypothetical protein